MSGWETPGGLKTIKLPKYASEMLGWETPGEPKTITWPEHSPEMSGLAALAELKTIILPEHALSGLSKVQLPQLQEDCVKLLGNW